MIPPRTRNAAATRETMLAAARRRFLDESYENVGLRDIAGDAGVDVALVARYFGSKEELFRQVLHGDKGEWLAAGLTAEALPVYLAALATEEGGPRDREHLEGLLIILRSASSPKASQIVRDAFMEDALAPLASLLDGGDREMRASLALALLMGTTVVRTIMGVEPLCREPCPQVRHKLERLLKEALAA